MILWLPPIDRPRQALLYFEDGPSCNVISLYLPNTTIFYYLQIRPEFCCISTFNFPFKIFVLFQWGHDIEICRFDVHAWIYIKFETFFFQCGIRLVLHNEPGSVGQGLFCIGTILNPGGSAGSLVRGFRTPHVYRSLLRI